MTTPNTHIISQVHTAEDATDYLVDILSVPHHEHAWVVHCEDLLARRRRQGESQRHRTLQSAIGIPHDVRGKYATSDSLIPWYPFNYKPVPNYPGIPAPLTRLTPWPLDPRAYKWWPHSEVLRLCKQILNIYSEIFFKKSVLRILYT